MKLYLADKAPNPDRVKFFLREKGVFEQIPQQQISIMANDHKSDAYRALSPLSQVPALELDDGAAITESRAICIYFEDMFPEPNLMGRTGRERAEIEMWDRRVELGYFLQIAHWFRNSHPAMAEHESPQCLEWAEISSGRAKHMAAFLDQRLASSPFVAGDRFTIADITLHVALGFGKLVKYKPWEEFAALGAWRERMLQRPSLA